MTSSPTSVRFRLLVPGPSESNSAPSFQRRPVTALPRRTTPVSGGIASADYVDEFLQPRLAGAERESDDVGALLLFGQLGLERLGLRRFHPRLR